jgi:hypothetical protein
MSRWEKFIHEDAPDRLIQLSLLHAEFEALHPFLDGNGGWAYDDPPVFVSGRDHSTTDVLHQCLPGKTPRRILRAFKCRFSQ